MLVENRSLRVIEGQFGTSKTALHRHKAHVPAELTLAKGAERVSDADGLLARVERLIAELQVISTKAQEARSWVGAAGALREVGRCLRLLGELSGELRSGPAVNVTLHLEKSVGVLLRATPDEFVSFWKSIVSQASPEQLSAALSAEKVQRALAASSPFFDSLLDRQAIGVAAAATLSEEDRSVLDKLRSFREEHQTVKCGDYRVVLDDVAMAL
jgi:hypothetical protein